MGAWALASELLGRVGDLGDLTEIHHRDPVGDVLDHLEVVRDEKVGQTQLLLEVLHEVDDLGLDRDVERRDRLVADDELRLDRQRARDADALPLPARELVRIARDRLAPKAAEIQELDDALRAAPRFE